MANTKPLKPINIAKRYKHIKPVPRMPNFAAWIEGVDLTKPLSEPVKQELRQALWDFEVIFFRPQILTPKQHVALAGVFGPSSDGSYFERNVHAPELEMIVFDEKRPPTIDSWHTDISWKEQPPLGTAIQITVTPPAGGNTCWISTTKAYEWLSPAMQKYLETLSAVHTWEIASFRDSLAKKGDEALFAALREFKPVTHPVIRKNADSGRKYVYVNSGFTKKIIGIDRHEADGVLRFLFDWFKRPEFMVHHQWETNGIAIWDNRSTQHYALADYWPHLRVNQRVTFDDPRHVAQTAKDAKRTSKEKTRTKKILTGA